MLACAEDAVVLENFSYGDTPEPAAIAALLDDVLGRGDVFDVAIHDLSNAYDIRTLVVKTLLTYLELEGIIESTGPFYSTYKFQPLKTSAEIIARVEGDRADFLRRILHHARKGKTWFSLDVDEVGRIIEEPRSRIVAALSYLEEVGDVVLQVAGVRQGYRVRNRPEDLAALCARLNDRFQKREENDIARIALVLALARHEGCLTQFLLNYFGEEHDECGHCCRCEGVRAQAILIGEQRPLDGIGGNQLHQLREKGDGSLDSPRQLARFLCGISSPATARAKMRGHPLFGVFDSVPFRGVLSFAEEQLLAGTR